MGLEIHEQYGGAEADGFHRGKVEPKLGIRASATCEIELTDYQCPVENRLGEEGMPQKWCQKKR